MCSTFGYQLNAIVKLWKSSDGRSSRVKFWTALLQHSVIHYHWNYSRLRSRYTPWIQSEQLLTSQFQLPNLQLAESALNPPLTPETDLIRVVCQTRVQVPSISRFTYSSRGWYPIGDLYPTRCSEWRRLRGDLACSLFPLSRQRFSLSSRGISLPRSLSHSFFTVVTPSVNW